jgi:hypothetical protein
MALFARHHRTQKPAAASAATRGIEARSRSRFLRTIDARKSSDCATRAAERKKETRWFAAFSIHFFVFLCKKMGSSSKKSKKKKDRKERKEKKKTTSSRRSPSSSSALSSSSDSDGGGGSGGDAEARRLARASKLVRGREI